MSPAELASVRAMRIVGTPSVSAARPRSDEFLDRFLGWHQHFAAEVSALLRGRKLIFEVHTGGAGFDHNFSSVRTRSNVPPNPASASATMGSIQSIARLDPRHVRNLIGAQQRIVKGFETTVGTLFDGI